jgi:plasmid stabilization system protein ParE
LTHQVVLRGAAERDLQSIEDWYELQREGLGSEFRAAADEAIQRITIGPLHYPDLYRGNRRVLLRRFEYAFWYRVQGDLIVVTCCVHGHRGPSYLKKRLGGGA